MRNSRHARGADIQERILLAAREEFCSKGLFGSQVEAIARKAEVTKQVIYYHFGSKSSLYEAMLAHSTGFCLSELEELPFDDMDPAEAIRVFFSKIFDFFVRDPFLVQLSLDWNFGAATQIRHGKMGKGVILILEKLLKRVPGNGDSPPYMNETSCFSLGMMIICASFLDRYGPTTADGLSSLAPEIALQRKDRVLAAIETILGIQEHVAHAPAG